MKYGLSFSIRSDSDVIPGISGERHTHTLHNIATTILPQPEYKLVWEAHGSVWTGTGGWVQCNALNMSHIQLCNQIDTDIWIGSKFIWIKLTLFMAEGHCQRDI